MKGLWELLKRYGQDVAVRYDGGRADAETRAFLQPMVERREDWRQEVPTPLGIMRRDRFLYLGDPAVTLEEADRVECGGRGYRVRTRELIRVGREASHWWAVLEPEDGGS